MPKKVEWGNPYTHEEHSRTSYSKEDILLNRVSTRCFGREKNCEWCGQLNRHGGLFEYNDSGKLFCSKSCHDTYYD